MRFPKACLTSLVLGAVVVSCANALAADVPRTFDLPRVEGIKIDGKAEDWEGKGHGFEILLPQYGKHRKAEDHNASMKLGWTRKGLLFLVWVQDDVWHRKTRQRDPIGQDHVEIYLRKVRLGKGSSPYHLTFNPQFGKLPLETACYGGLELGAGNVDRSVRPTYSITGGKTWYVLEGLVPWESVGFEAAPGAQACFQLWVQDGDTMEKEELRKHRASFHLGKGTSYNGNDMHTLKLMDNTKPRLRLSAVAGYDLSTYQSVVKVMARGVRRGHEVVIKQGGRDLARGQFEAVGPDRVATKIALPAPSDGTPYTDLLVSYRGETVNTVSLPHSAAIGQLKDLVRKKTHYANLYKVDEPWVRQLASPVLEQHRGLVAAALALLDRVDPPSSQADFALLSQAAQAVKMADRGESYYDQRRGCFFGYIYSNALGTGSYFLCSVPNSYDPSRKYPLVYSLHAGGAVLEPHDKPVERDYLEVSPWGHGYNSFRGMGETAAREVLAYVLRWYSIDRNRVHVRGHSNGGNGSWFLTTRYPRFFASASISAGEPLNHLFFSNLGNVTILNRCGALDAGQPANIIHWADSRLKQLGHPMDLRIFPKEGHGRVAPFDSAAWRSKHVRSPSPRKVSHSCEWAAHGQSYWFSIKRLADPHRVARVDAEVARKGGRQTVILKLANVDVLALDASAMPVDGNKPLRINMAGSINDVKAPLPAQLYMVRGASGWQLKRNWQAPATTIRPYRSGGAENMYSGEPLMIVYPTQGVVVEMGRLKEAAERLSCSGGGGPMPTARFPMKAGKDITQADMEHYNLVLLGKIEDNKVTQRIWPQLPFSLEGEKTLKAGERTLDVQDCFVSLHLYNPLAPRRLVYIVAPMGKAGQNRMWTRALPFFLVRAGRAGMGAVPDLVVRGLERGAPVFRYGMQFTRGWTWKSQNPMLLAYRFQGIGKDHFTSAARALVTARCKAGFVLARKESGSTAPPWGLDPKRTTGADWILGNSGDAVALSVVTGKTMVDLEEALSKTRGRGRNQGMAFYPALARAKVDPVKKYTIAFQHRILRLIRTSYGNLPNVEAGPRYTARDLLVELMNARR